MCNRIKQENECRQFKVLLLPFSADDNGQKCHQSCYRSHADPDNCHVGISQGSWRKTEPKYQHKRVIKHWIINSSHCRRLWDRNGMSVYNDNNMWNHQCKVHHEYANWRFNAFVCFRSFFRDAIYRTLTWDTVRLMRDNRMFLTQIYHIIQLY